ncbi:hypothetical protein VOLCADRAFT_90921 [Volvox carteri f. nagariensis]|uniref:Pherophorin domain-containing protein n=1 Tax=Volvox carteri f. nagariensis TaxID=3068 RepID=D8TVQ7_VOLCA|nr:uncharacterized protein VOLCADRAFT_90921 [Volvox carteri f. nagariensis]EFJ48344.1 hypothetical protein VOLCADRAFT_90921 [Volvox carteri f. nagariensis]|eukprot:XP_002950598.1 hypothetical protein VOLCADRAFT_90921 [Volvox carteri f. nagariensis]
MDEQFCAVKIATMRRPRATAYLLWSLVLALIAQFGEVRSSHFRAGIIEYRVSQTDPSTLDIVVTTCWMYYDSDSVSLYGSGGSYLFTTNSYDVVGDGYDALGNRYAVLRTVGSAAVPTDAGEISASNCCRIDGLVGGAYPYALDDFRFAVNYVPGVNSSIVTQAPAVMLVGRAASSGTYAYTFVPAVSSHGASIDCSINTGLANTAPMAATS